MFHNILSKLKNLPALYIILLGVTVLMFISDIIYPQISPRREGKDLLYTINSDYFKYTKASKLHSETVTSAKSYFETYCSINRTVISFPWAPVFITLLEGINPTKYDMMNHDYWVEKEADEAITILKEKPVCMIITQFHKEDFYLDPPFPAKAERKMNAFLKDFVEEKYIKVDTLKTHHYDIIGVYVLKDAYNSNKDQ